MNASTHDSGRRRWLTVGAVWLCLLALGGCGETTFDPFEDRALHFSLFGYLDAGADTQFVRVTPLREGRALPEGPLGATMTLEALDTGATVALRDSVFRLAGGPVHNAWTTARLAPGGRYRLRVEGVGGASSADITLPDAFPDPALAVPTDPVTDPRVQLQSILLTGVERVAEVQLQYRVRLPGQGLGLQSVTLSYRDRIADIAAGKGLSFNAYNDLRARFPDACPIVHELTLFVAAAGPGWPDFAGIDAETLARPDVISNVEGGVGFVGGIYAKRLAWPELFGFLALRRRLCEQTGE